MPWVYGSLCSLKSRYFAHICKSLCLLFLYTCGFCWVRNLINHRQQLHERAICIFQLDTNTCFLFLLCFYTINNVFQLIRGLKMCSIICDPTLESLFLHCIILQLYTQKDRIHEFVAEEFETISKTASKIIASLFYSTFLATFEFLSWITPCKRIRKKNNFVTLQVRFMTFCSRYHIF